MEIVLEVYKTAQGQCPFDDWFENIKDLQTRSRIIARLDRLKLGNFGDCKSLGEGLAELRIHYGPGIRIYYSKIGNTVIVLFCGGDKSSQERDINKAKALLKEYQSRKAKK